jgi:putative drug exporter of the RND superfamily
LSGSLVIPLVSIVLNLLSVGAAYGLITLIFQDGRLQGPQGYTSFGAIIWWEPLFMFVILFGISMDYHVFLLTRIRELRAGGSATRDAVAAAIAIDATLVRGILLPAALTLLGDRTWSGPGWLRRPGNAESQR